MTLICQRNCLDVRLQINLDALNRRFEEKLAQKLLPVELGSTKDHQVVVKGSNWVLHVVPSFQLLVERQLFIKNLAVKLLNYLSSLFLVVTMADNGSDHFACSKALISLAFCNRSG
jgi:hypothetical protein